MALEFTEGANLMVRGALAAGCDFFAGYPITPTTAILIGMTRELPARGGVAIQGEDEIASISMCIGASMAGRKAMTASSGPGLSLYSENIGLAVMGETPLVIVDGQRLGPATGGATTSAQGDVLFAANCTAGGLPMVVLCPGSVESLFTTTVRAFNVAERLRTPVIILTCKDMLLSRYTVDPANLVTPTLEARPRFEGPGDFVPYKFDALSDVPEFLPFGAEQPVRFTTSMHDEFGYLTKDPLKAGRKNAHLAAKILDNRADLEFYQSDSQEDAEVLLVAYGINGSVCREVLFRLREQGIRTSLLILETLFPEPEIIIRSMLAGVKRVILPELNRGLYAGVFRAFLEPGQELISVPRVDGGLISADYLLEQAGFL